MIQGMVSETLRVGVNRAAREASAADGLLPKGEDVSGEAGARVQLGVRMENLLPGARGLSACPGLIAVSFPAGTQVCKCARLPSPRLSVVMAG